MREHFSSTDHKAKSSPQPQTYGAIRIYNGVLCISLTQGGSYITHMYNAKAYFASGVRSPLTSTMIARRDHTEQDVRIEIQFCGICVLISIRFAANGTM